MKLPGKMPCARSEATDPQDVLVSALLWRAGEVLEWLNRNQAPCSPKKHRLSRRKAKPDIEQLPPSPFQSVVASLLDFIRQESDIAKLLAELPSAFGSGVLLPSVFNHLFTVDPQPVARMLDDASEIHPLTSSERGVLLQLVNCSSHKEIAARLHISPKTVGKHFEAIYDKLGLTRATPSHSRANPQLLLVKAIAMGIIPLDFAESFRPLRESHGLSFNALAAVCLSRCKDEHKPLLDIFQPLASLGIQLLLLPALLTHALSEHSHNGSKGMILEMTPEGRHVRCLGCEAKMTRPHGLAFAPHSARRHGFIPGNLFVVDSGSSPNVLNTNSIIELSPQGSYVRSFTGGSYISTRLASGSDIAFTRDGRLLVTSPELTEAILEFTSSGAKVRRMSMRKKASHATSHRSRKEQHSGDVFIDRIVPYGLAIDQDGYIHIAGGTARESWVRVVDDRGNVVHELGPIEPESYSAVTVNEKGDTYVGNRRSRAIEVFDSGGRRRRVIGKGHIDDPLSLAVSPAGSIYVIPDRIGTVIEVFSPTGRHVTSLKPLPNSRFNSVAFGPKGNLYVSASSDN